MRLPHKLRRRLIRAKLALSRVSAKLRPGGKLSLPRRRLRVVVFCPAGISSSFIASEIHAYFDRHLPPFGVTVSNTHLYRENYLEELRRADIVIPYVKVRQMGDLITTQSPRLSEEWYMAKGKILDVFARTPAEHKEGKVYLPESDRIGLKIVEWVKQRYRLPRWRRKPLLHTSDYRSEKS